MIGPACFLLMSVLLFAVQYFLVDLAVFSSGSFSLISQQVSTQNPTPFAITTFRGVQHPPFWGVNSTSAHLFAAFMFALDDNSPVERVLF